MKSESRNKIKLLLKRHAADKFLSILILNAIYAPALDVNLLSSNALEVEHDLCVILDISDSPSQILRDDILIGRIICQNNLYFVDLADMDKITLYLHVAAVNKKPIFL